MSWLFGIKSNPQPQPDFTFGDPGQGGSAGGGGAGAAGGAGGGGGGKDPPKDDKGTESRYRFDSAALERAAEAAKNLEKSAHAKEAFELARMQEQTKQKEMDTEMSKFMAMQEQSKMEAIRVAAEERQKILQEEAKLNKQRALYEDELARRRYADQLEQSKRAQEETLRKQEESVQKQEQIRQQTIQREMQMREQERKNRVKEEAEVKAKVERENRDIYLEQLRLKAQESRITTLESIKTIGSVVGTGLSSFVSDWDKMVQAAGAMTLLALGVYTAKNSTHLAARRLEAILGRPSLVRETSRVSPLEVVQHPIQTAKKVFRKTEEALKGVVLQPKLEERLRDVAIATKNTRTNKGCYRNVMFYGPPGTGKTLFAKRLAAHSGMDYALLSGGDVAPLGKDGVTAIHKVFDWANSSRKGLVLFLDEADAFLRKRSAEKMSEEMRTALNAFLYRTGEQSKKVMIVLASNTPEQLDFAVNDRIDEMVHFTLPGVDERERLVRLYFDEFILQLVDKGSSRLKLAEFDFIKTCSEVSTICKGMSGREIAKLASSWQASGFASESGILTKEMMLDRARDAAKQHEQKTEWLADSEKAKVFAV